MITQQEIDDFAEYDREAATDHTRSPLDMVKEFVWLCSYLWVGLR